MRLSVGTKFLVGAGGASGVVRRGIMGGGMMGNHTDQMW